MIEQKLKVMKHLSQSLRTYQQAVAYYQQQPSEENYQSVKQMWGNVDTQLKILEDVFRLGGC